VDAKKAVQDGVVVVRTEVCGCMGYSCNNRHNPVEHLVAEEDENDDM